MTFYAVALTDPENEKSRLYRIQANNPRVAAWVGFCHYINKETSATVDPYDPGVADGWSEVKRWFLPGEGDERLDIETAFGWQDLIGSVHTLATLPDVKFESEKLIYPKSNDSER